MPCSERLARSHFIGLIAPVLIASLASAGDIAPSRSELARRAEESLRTAHFFNATSKLHTAADLEPTYRLMRQAAASPLDFLRRQTGFLVEDQQPLGLFWADAGGATVATVGCAACHVGRAAGRTYIGLGNKTIDVAATGRLIYFGSLLGREATADAEARRLADNGVRLGQLMSDERYSNPTRGLVSTALIHRWFYDASQRPLPEGFPRGLVKVPNFWGYEKKYSVGAFADGFADAKSLGWSGLVELSAGQSFAGYQEFRERLKSLKEELPHLLPPSYPFAVDADRAHDGAAVFAENCADCHGAYRRDEAGLPIFESPRFIPLADVGTDDDRIRYRTEEFLKLIDDGPWRDDFRYHNREPGYVAPRLEGIWSRFPYLHNGSVPTLAAMLTPPAERPTYWSLEDAGEAHRFDETAVGLTLPSAGSDDDRNLARRAAAGDRDVYFVERVGHSNRGHEFGTDLSGDDKRALLEYLKSL